jgi:hypothetical protein
MYVKKIEKLNFSWSVFYQRQATAGHSCPSKDDISKKIPIKPGSGLILRVYSAEIGLLT